MTVTEAVVRDLTQHYLTVHRATSSGAARRAQEVLRRYEELYEPTAEERRLAREAARKELDREGDLYSTVQVKPLTLLQRRDLRRIIWAVEENPQLAHAMQEAFRKLSERKGQRKFEMAPVRAVVNKAIRTIPVYERPLSSSSDQRAMRWYEQRYADFLSARSP